ncbi:MAG: DNA primase [Coriobacteriales bacterium]|jgi:DNA primase|nr:DNA primase [Coriobacteriales bacterium]
MSIEEADIRKVREATDLVALVGERVVLKPRGREFWGNCPFHNEKTPSFKVSPSTQLYHCFGCGESGDAITFVRKLDGLDFIDAVRYLAERAHIELKETGGSKNFGQRARLFQVMQRSASFYQQQLMRTKTPEADAARSYLSSRGLSGAIARKWQMGFAPGHGLLLSELTQAGFSRDDMIAANVAAKSNRDGRLYDRFFNRIIFTINDLQGRPIAFGGRIIGAGEPKYLNTSETPLFSKGSTLYALDKAKANITSTGTAIVVEGYTDTIAMHEAGFTNTVATLGTALTNEHIKILARFAKKLVYLFDGDAAGQRAADRASSLITKDITAESGPRQIDLFVVVLPNGADPADFLSLNDAGAMGKLVQDAKPLLRFAIDRRLDAFDLDVPEQRSRALVEALRILVPIYGTMLASNYVSYIADRLGVTYEVADSCFKTLKKESAYDDKRGLKETTAKEAGAKEAGAKEIDAKEQELIVSFVAYPSLRPLMSKAFKSLQWSREENKSMAQLLQQLDYELTPAQVSSILFDAFPQAATYIAGAELSADEEVAKNRVMIQMYSLREQQLEIATRRSIAKLRTLKADTEDYDSLSATIAQMQHELIDTRRKLSELPKGTAL